MNSRFLPYDQESSSERRHQKSRGKRTFHINKLLVPIDFSPASINAFQYAVRLAQPFGASVRLMHAYMPSIVEPYMAVVMQEALIKQQEGIALTHFGSLAETVPPEILSDISLDYVIRMGMTTDEILEACTEFEADHIIMGMRGSNVMQKKLLGSTTAKVVQKANCPVVIIPEEVHYQPIKNIAYATNFESEDPRIIDVLVDMAKVYQASLQIVHIRQQGVQIDSYKQDILQKAYAFDAQLRNIDFDLIDYPNLIRGLSHYIETHHIDMLGMLTHQRGIFGNLIHPSQTQKMAIQSPVPLWAYQIS